MVNATVFPLLSDPFSNSAKIKLSMRAMSIESLTKHKLSPGSERAQGLTIVVFHVRCTTADRMAAHRRLDRHRDNLCGAHFIFVFSIENVFWNRASIFLAMDSRRLSPTPATVAQSSEYPYYETRLSHRSELGDWPRHCQSLRGNAVQDSFSSSR